MSNIIYGAMEYAVFPGGKRIRPLLCMEMCRACGGDLLNAMPQACALEFIHSFSLVHDDLPSMDNDDMRRGKPAVHKKYGEALAVLTGDALLALAFRALAEIKEPSVLSGSLKVIADAAGSSGITGGQALDIKYALKKRSFSFLKKTNKLKTAVLFEASVKAGALAAGASKKMLLKAGMYGKYFGEAFQVRDDIMDGEYERSALPGKMRHRDKLVKKAKSSLDIFGKKADNLKSIADMLTK